MAVDTNVTLQSANGEANTLISLAVAASANGIALAQTPLVAGLLVLNGALIVAGVYPGTGARRLVVASDNAADAGVTIRLVGTDRNGQPLTETLTLTGAATITSANDFLTLTSATISGAAAGNITVGTSAVASGSWVAIDRFRNNPISLAVIGQLISGAVNWTLEHTYDDPNTPPVAGTYQLPVAFPLNTNNPGALNVGDAAPAQAWPDVTLVAKAGTAEGSIALPYAAYRFTVNSGTGVFKGQVRTAAMASGMR